MLHRYTKSFFRWLRRETRKTLRLVYVPIEITSMEAAHKLYFYLKRSLLSNWLKNVEWKLNISIPSVGVPTYEHRWMARDYRNDSEKANQFCLLHDCMRKCIVLGLITNGKVRKQVAQEMINLHDSSLWSATSFLISFSDLQNTHDLEVTSYCYHFALRRSYAGRLKVPISYPFHLERWYLSITHNSFSEILASRPV